MFKHYNNNEVNSHDDDGVTRCVTTNSGKDGELSINGAASATGLLHRLMKLAGLYLVITIGNNCAHVRGC